VVNTLLEKSIRVVTAQDAEAIRQYLIKRANEDKALELAVLVDISTL
jgi:hypothetical protein